ncbi:MAG: methyltransferase domain-containing protein [Methylacidiphilales bacterium]|nr:methyltransferase domain-containing protein [Candidatus Methylacidiphilales bacterium]
MGILAPMQRQFSDAEPELMDLPSQDEAALRSDLENIARLNRTFGGRKAVEIIFHKLADKTKQLVLVDLASGYGDHGRNLLQRARERSRDITIVAVDVQFQTLQIARSATPPGQKMFFIQADARQLPFRTRGADLVFCSLALHHFAENDALTVLREMGRVGRRGTACVDLVRSRLAAFCIWLLTTFIIRDPMVRHDARLSVRRAFTGREMKSLANRAGWPNLKQIKFFWFQQAVMARASQD